MQRLGLALSLVLSVSSTFACSDAASDDGGDETGGSGGSATGGSATAGSATGGSATGGSATGGSATGGSATGGSATGGSGGAGTTGGSAGSGGGGFTKTGICGHRSEATVSVMGTSYSGTEEWYMVSEEAIDDGRLDEYSCLIRFDVMRVSAAPAGCVDLEAVACEWSAKVEVSNPTIVTNVNGACENNELGWNMMWMNGLVGTQASYGYVDMYQGHDSVVMKAAGAPGAETWAVYGRASWLPDTGEFSFDNRLGECQY
jgi:hypothetical protein